MSIRDALAARWKKALARPIGVVGMRQRDKTLGTGIMDTLWRLGNELETLTSGTEGEFLSIGEKLQDFHRRATETAKLSQAAALLMSGEDATTVIAGFRNIVSGMERLGGESEAKVKALSRFSEILAGLYRQLNDFPKTVRRLRILCISIKIEAARLGEGDIGFSDLSDEVGKLAVDIEEKCSHLLERSECLNDVIGKARTRVQDLAAGQNAQARLILDRTLSSIDAITEKHSIASAGVTHLSTSYEGISQNIGRIVASMQFHDITRQRIQHAKEALAGIAGAGQRVHKTDAGRAHIVDALPSSFRTCKRPEATPEQLHLAGDICELQVSRLRRAGSELVSAVESIMQGLGEISNLVAGISLETQRMVGAVDETGRSSLTEVEEGIASILTAHSEYAAANEEVSRVVGSVGDTLGEMSAYTGDIEGIGEKIKLIALNAIVKAAHVGDGGATLGVLAEVIHQLSVETRSLTEKVSGSLQSIIAKSRSLVAEGDSDKGADRESSGSRMDCVRESLTSLPDTLRNMNEGMVALLTRMNAQGRGLSTEILEVVEGIGVHHRINGVIDKVACELSEIAGLAGSKTRDEDSAETAQLMRALQASYTMEGERQVHQSVVAARSALDELPPDGPALSMVREAGVGEEKERTNCKSEDGLGDNVELF